MSIPLPHDRLDWLAVAVVVVALVWPEISYQWGRLWRWWRGAY